MLKAMKAVAHDRRGIAYRYLRKAKYNMAGKTGTAQVVGIKQGEEYDAEVLAERQRDHALFVGFAPYERPEIAVAVIVENAGAGSSQAAPVAKKMFDAYLQDKPLMSGVERRETY